MVVSNGAPNEKYFVSELGGYSLLQCRPCLVGDFVCIAAGNSIRVYSGNGYFLWDLTPRRQYIPCEPNFSIGDFKLNMFFDKLDSFFENIFFLKI